MVSYTLSHPHPLTVQETYETRNTLVSLENLKQLTEYCFQIQALLQNGALRGKVSDQQCVKTTASGMYFPFLSIVITVP